MTALLQVERLNKQFAGLHAVKDVSFALEPGSITGVLGPNGAGKTPVFNLLTGFSFFDSGAVHLDGRPLAGLSPHRIVNRGLARTFQLARPFLGMTGWTTWKSHALLRVCATPDIRACGLTHGSTRLALATSRCCRWTYCHTATCVGSRSRGHSRLSRNCCCSMNPLPGLGAGEIEPLAALIRRLHRSEGLTVLIIEHKLREFMQLVESVIAMDFGEIVAIGDPSAIVRHPRVVEAYLGKAELGLRNIEPTGAGDGAA